MTPQSHRQYQSFINYLSHEKRYSEHTILAYQRDIDQCWAFMTEQFEITSLEEVHHHFVRAYMVHLMERGLAAKSINRKLSSLKSLYKFLVKRFGYQSNPTAKVQAPKLSKRLPSFVEADKLDDLLTTMDFPDDYQGHRDKLMIDLFYSAGIRRSELIDLRLEDVDFAQQVLKVRGKGNKERLIPMHPGLMEHIDTYLSVREQLESIQCDHLMLTEKGKKMYPKLVYNRVKHYLGSVTTAEYRGPHALRHSFATHLTNNGAELNAVKDLLGHASLAATQVYTHNTMDKLKQIHKQAHPRS